MKKAIQKFLEFNGKSIAVLAADGQHYVAIKPICEALSVDYVRAAKNLREDDFFGQLASKQTSTGADGKYYYMLVLPERYIYGWILSLRSDSEGLKEYKRACYDLLYEHFHGATTDRLNILKVKTEAEMRIEQLEAELYQDARYKELADLKAGKKGLQRSLRENDKEMVSAQMELWGNNN